jgi:hypothetical protein
MWSDAQKSILVDEIAASFRDLHAIPCNVVFFLGGHLSPHSLRPVDMFDKRILTGALRFFSASRKHAEMDRLLRAPCACSEQAKLGGIHAWAQDALVADIQSGRSKWPLQTIMAQVLTYIVKAMESNRPRRLKKYMPHLDAITHANVWPQTPGQILPHGAEGMIRGLVSWFKVDIGEINVAVLVRLLDAIYGYTSQVTLPYIINSPTFVSHGILPVLERGCDLMESALPAALAIFEDSRTVLFSIAMHRCSPTHRRVFLESHAVALLRLCDRAVQLMASSRRRIPTHNSEEEQMRLDSLGWMIGGFAGMLMQDLFWWTQGKVAYKFSAIPTLPHLDSFFARALNALEYSSEGQCCGSPNCTRSFLDTDSFQLCGGCRRVTYCSRRCQITAWGHPATAHRSICDAIRRMCIESKVPRTHMKVLKFNKKGIPERFDEALGRLIAEHFDALIRYRMGRFSSTDMGILNCAYC